MNDEVLKRLVGMFGVNPFTSAEAYGQLDAGLGGVPPLRSLAAALRAAVGRRVTYGPREVTLRHAGTVHDRKRRWCFEVVPGEFGDPDESDGSDLI